MKGTRKPSPSGRSLGRDTIKLRGVPKAFATAAAPKGAVQHQGNDLGGGNNAEDVTMDNPQPSASAFTRLCVQFND